MKVAWGVACVVAAGLALSACASHKTRPAPGNAPSAPGALPNNIHADQAHRYRLQHDRGPAQPPVDIAKLPEPVPKVEPRSRYGNKSPYTVNGHTYYVLPSAKGYDERGLASWYGKKFNGYLTSSMERYDMYKFTAASKVLPLPTFARVTNLANGKSVIVRVNDRGPFVSGRIIDLSYAAAVRIGIWPKGTGRVEVKAIVPGAHKELSKPSAVAPTSAAKGEGVWLQVGAFADENNARRVASRLRHAGVGSVHLSRIKTHGHELIRVRIGPLQGTDAVQRVRTIVKRLGLPASPVALH